MNEQIETTTETVDVPLPPAELAAERMECAPVHVEEIPAPNGHFSVDYRRC